MQDKKQKINDEEIAKKTIDALDDLGSTLKKSSRKIFDALVERTVDTISDVFDKKIKNTKEKLKKGLKNEEKNT